MPYKTDRVCLEVCTGGSCLNNGQSGATAGIGVYFEDHDPPNYSGRLIRMAQTNQCAELAAIRQALFLVKSFIRDHRD
ncbi:hypothetical protein IWW38_002992, partial [Coemansia aciculifera]